MVVTRLIGGLGNQMFQYAAARAIAYRTGSELLLDVSAYDNFRLFPFSLRHLNIRADVASADDVYRIRRAHSRSPLARLSRRFPSLRPFCRNIVATERHFHFDPAIVRLRGNVYLDGYWQSEKYFQDIADTIRAELTVSTPPDRFNETMAERIRGAESVSLHIRRGDYVSNPDANAFHGSCDLAYYKAAVANIADGGVRPEIFVFSDDPAWARENLELAHPTTYVVQEDPSRSFDDMRLMSFCSHHIIANSTFSWWGAWLGTNPYKRVIAPRQWFQGSDWNTDDLIPSSWTRI